MLEQLQQAQKLAEQLRQGGLLPLNPGTDPSMRSPLGDPASGEGDQLEMQALIEQLNQIAKSLPPDFNINGLPLPSNDSFLPERLQDWAQQSSGSKPRSRQRSSSDRSRSDSSSKDGKSDSSDGSSPQKSSNWLSQQGIERMMREQMKRNERTKSDGGMDVDGDWTKRVFESVFKAASAHSDEIVQEMQKPENQQKFAKWIQRGRQINDWLVKQKHSVRNRVARNTPDVSLPPRPSWGGGWGGPSVPNMSWDLTGAWTLLILVGIGAVLAAAVVWGRQQIASGRGILPAWISIPNVEDRQTLIAAVHGTARRNFGPSAEYWTIQRLAVAAAQGDLTADHETAGRTKSEETVERPDHTMLTQRLLDLYNFSRYARPELKLSEAQLAEARSALDELQQLAKVRHDGAAGGWWSSRDKGSADG